MIEERAESWARHLMNKGLRAGWSDQSILVDIQQRRERSRSAYMRDKWARVYDIVEGRLRERRGAVRVGGSRCG